MKIIGIDAGGTSFKVLVIDGSDGIVARNRVATTSPQETLGEVAQWIDCQKSEHPDIAAIGIASFGPIDRDPASPDWGRIGVTTKDGWEGANPRRALAQSSGLPCALETDVNAALLGECELGAGLGLSDAAYLTIGTGVGGAALVDGALVGAPWHGEFGHVRLRREPSDIAAFAGSCTFHGDCVEGIASATAIRSRWKAQPHELPDDHECWVEVSSALAQLCHAIACLVAPQRIILGGGLMLRDSLLARIRSDFDAVVGGYASRPEVLDASTYIVRAGLGDDAGAIGGAAVARHHLAVTGGVNA
ncbi:ROK family protein [Aurantiacibacter sp. D1-12]|uniref:ROK family protein n=1 Tax=Aurantiacibacter sp. D1-12 TaxID=2993658 RepID=UPI00237CD76A|nr:ROK family protein [Aurantiacibacter sp. D1-12]MDE1467740.1 ROK family protein [Aurantiacibacter sp. D1-12]